MLLVSEGKMPHLLSFSAIVSDITGTLRVPILLAIAYSFRYDVV